MFLGQKSRRIISSLGVKSSIPHFSLGVKSYGPQLDDSLIKNHTPDGIIHNNFNSNSMQREPILGIKLQYHKVNHNGNYLEKARKIINEKNRNHSA